MQSDTLCFQGTLVLVIAAYYQYIEVFPRLVSALLASSGDTLRALSSDTLSAISVSSSE